MKRMIDPFPFEKVPVGIRDDVEELFYNMAFNPKCGQLKELWLVGKCLTDEFTEQDKIELITTPVSGGDEFEAYLAAIGGTCIAENPDRFEVHLPDIGMQEVIGMGGTCLRLV